MPPREAGRDRLWTIGAMAACAAILAPTLAFRLGVDQGVFAYMGAALLRGSWPYVGTWESDFPGMVFLQAVEIAAFGRSIAMFRLFDLLFQLANTWFIYRITERLSHRTAALVAATLYCLIYQHYGPWNTAQREGFGVLFILAGVWLYLTADRRSAGRTAFLIGLGFGLAVTIKPTLLALAAFYAPLLSKLRTRQAARAAAAAAIGLIGPAAAIAGGYWIAGHLRDLYEACIAYQDIYTARLRGGEPIMAFWLGKLARLGLNAKLLPIAYLPLVLTGRGRPLRLMLWLGYLGATFAVFVQGTFAGYHYLPGLALGAIMLGDMFEAACRWDSRHGVFGEWWTRHVRTVLAAGTMLLASVFYLRDAPFRDLVTLRFLGPPRPGEFRVAQVFDYTESHEVAAYLRDRTRPDEPIQIWGYESLVYYLADRPAASRFQMTHPLVMRVPGSDITPMQQRWRQEFLVDLAVRRPAYVAVVRGDDWWWAPDERTSEQLLDDFPAWKALIHRDYVLEAAIGRFLVYRRAGTTQP